MSVSFTKNETAGELVKKMKETFEAAGSGKFEKHELELSRG